MRYIGKKPASIAISQHVFYERFNFICSGTEHNLGIKLDGRMGVEEWDLIPDWSRTDWMEVRGSTHPNQ